MRDKILKALEEINNLKGGEPINLSEEDIDKAVQISEELSKTFGTFKESLSENDFMEALKSTAIRFLDPKK